MGRTPTEDITSVSEDPILKNWFCEACKAAKASGGGRGGKRLALSARADAIL
jgi:hypothetical protein